MKGVLKQLENCDGFEWDDNNRNKNLEKHNVTTQEIEQVFFNQPQIHFYDHKHSQKEPRYGLLGITEKNRWLAVFYTIRKNKIRVISARNQKRGAERNKFKIRKAK